MEKRIGYLLLTALGIVEVVLILTVVTFVVELFLMDGYHHVYEMEWYDSQLTNIATYLVFPLRYLFNHFVLSAFVGGVLYGVVFYKVWEILRK